MDYLNENNRGPRGKGSKNQKGFTPVALAVEGQNIPLAITKDSEKGKPSLIPNREQYNHPDFPVTCADAKFFSSHTMTMEAQQNSGGCGVSFLIGKYKWAWHIVKDVPNSLLKHITLENNENKPVTNSRDTQEAKWSRSQKSSEVSAGLNKENSRAAQTTTGELKLTNNVCVTKSGDNVKGAKPVTVSEKKPVAKGVENWVATGC
ncbi:hypothetical protein HAX54_010539 [Datura stramonium]|uniref:YTH domain-containing family protein n=1 Tax=Datura stramonium TaxID=4076 RepID=A0ABS8TGD1_DATST|nr:hypothetical protein [Datura stramonium]